MLRTGFRNSHILSLLARVRHTNTLVLRRNDHDRRSDDN